MSIRCGACKGRHETLAAVRSCNTSTSSATARMVRPPGPAAEGVYRRGEKIFRVSINRNTGRAYAEEWIAGAYSYAKGWVLKLRPDERLTLDEARAWGRANVRCIRCGTRLERKESREAGIGPICAGKI